jgi:DNA-binding NarL/FixJ family response regulator
MLEAIGRATSPLVLVTGFAGVGRTTLLDRVADLFTGRGATVWAMRFTPDGEPVPAHFGSPSPADLPSRHTVAGSPWPWTPLRPVDGASHDPLVARRAAAATVAPLLRAHGETVLLIDDAQWIDPESLAVLAALVRRIAGSPVRCVCTARVPSRTAAPGVLAALRALRGDRLVQTFRVTPWPRHQVARETAGVLRASPEPALVDQVYSASRGVAAAVVDAIRTLQREGRVQVVDRRAYLAHGKAPAERPVGDQLVRRAREPGPGVYAVAKAAAVLSPLGAEMPRLVAEALGLDAPDVLESLESLRASGVLHRGRAGASWRFSLPLVASALAADLGPFERRMLAATAVSAVWTGVAACADDDHLTNQIADAGTAVNRERALSELLSRADSAQHNGTVLAPRWLAAAVELTAEQRERALVLLTHTVSCHLHGEHESSLGGARTLLREHAGHLATDAVQEVQLIAVEALYSLGDTKALADLAAARHRQGDRDEHRAVTQAAAAALLDRWTRVTDLLAAEAGPRHAGNPTSAMHGDLLASMADLWAGRLGRFEASLGAQWSGIARHRLHQVRSYATALLVLGDPDRAERLLSDENLTPGALSSHARALLAALRGDAREAVDLTRRSMAVERRRHDPGHAGMLQATITLLALQGRLTSARELLRLARAQPCVLAHLLDIAEAWLDRALGDNAKAVSRLHDTLKTAADRGLAAGVELCWAELADLALEHEDHDAARSALAALTELAGTTPTARVTLYASLVKATVDRDRTAALRCLQLVRARAQPFELAVVLERLVRHGVAEAELLTEAYELFGALDAVLARAWLRNLMRDHAIAVRGRTETVAENERLLSLLAADGLTNKQLAAALRASEKSIEGRLSRLFTRSGHRSRIELSTAMLSAEGG